MFTTTDIYTPEARGLGGFKARRAFSIRARGGV